MSGVLVCFHGLRRCPPCGVDGRGAPRARRRCPACGRFTPKGRRAAHCARCVERGFHALTLPLQLAG